MMKRKLNIFLLSLILFNATAYGMMIVSEINPVLISPALPDSNINFPELGKMNDTAAPQANHLESEINSLLAGYEAIARSS